MIEVLLFVEDMAQEQFLKKIALRVANETSVAVSVKVRSAYGGSVKVINELEKYVSRWECGKESLFDILIIGIDANCHGYAERRKEVDEHAGRLIDRVVHAIPDPHIERWFLLDGNAFKSVLGRGCQAPDKKCEKSRYKCMLAQAIRDAGVKPLFGGIEYAEGLANIMDLKHASKLDNAFGRFVSEYKAILNRLK